MQAELIAIGTELLLGYVVNEDTTFLGRVLAGLGVSCYRQVTVGDNPNRLAQAIQAARSRADLVITCGGLGPTVDDVTLETIARVTRRKLVLHRSILRQIRQRFRRLGIRMPASNARQAKVPEGAVVFPNLVGTAPGFLLKLNPKGSDPVGSDPKIKLLVALPGPPAELQPMVKRHLIPRLRRYASKGVIHSRTLKLTGVMESEVDSKVRDLLALEGGVTVGIYAHPAQVDLRITARADSLPAAQRRITQIEAKIRRRFKHLIYGADDETLEGIAGKLLRRSRRTLAVAESCTGGLVGHRITQVPGSSDYFRGGVVAYADAVKEAVLGVPSSTLRRQGAVSPQIARAMADGIRKLTGSDLGLAITGIAGPAGGSKTKPVGLVYLGLATPQGTQVQRHQFSGDRSTVKFKASQAALDLVRWFLLSA